MMQRRPVILFLCVAWMSLLPAGFTLAADPAPAREPTVRGLTETPAPQDLKLSFDVGGVIKEVRVKPGDKVKAGDVVMVLDDRVERKRLEALEVEATSELQIAAAKADLAQKKVTLARKEKMYADRVASLSELEEAKLEVDIAEIRVKVAEQERQLKTIERDSQKVRVELMTLTSPIDGYVERITIGVGEVFDAVQSDPVIQIVSNDTLNVSIRELSLEQVRKLKLDQVMEVRYEDESEWQSAKVIFIGKQGDGSSNTQLVRLEMPNTGERASGSKVLVKLPADVAALAGGNGRLSAR